MSESHKTGIPPTIWIVDDYLGASYPSVKKYELVELRKTGPIVRIRGFPKFLPKAAGRKFFTNEAEFWEYIRGWLSIALERAKRRVVELENAVLDPSASIYIDTTPGQARPKDEKLILE